MSRAVRTSLAGNALVTRVRVGIAAGLAAVVLGMLWFEFSEPGHLLWNLFLALLLAGFAVATAAAVRYFRAHAGEIGEARFETPEEPHG